MCGEHSADRLDPEILCTHVVDELDYSPKHLRCREVPPRRRGSSSLAKKFDAEFVNFVGFLEFSVLTFEIFDALWFRGSSTGNFVGINLGLLGPVPQRFGTNTEFRAYHLTCGVDGPIFVEMIEDHPDGSLTLLGWVTLGHDLHPSQKRMRHQTRHGSKCPSLPIAGLYTGHEVGVLVTNFSCHGDECLDQWGGAPAPSDAKLRTRYLFEHSVHE